MARLSSKSARKLTHSDHEPESQRLLTVIQKLSERELTETVIVPVLNAMGYERTEYHHGPTERGKDLICWATDRLGDQELAVVQVKRFTFSGRSADSKSFPGVITQLGQAAEQPVPNISGVAVLPASVFLITPFAVDARVLQSRFEGFVSLRARGVRIIDGPKLVELTRKHLPTLADRLIGKSFDLATAILPLLNNQALLEALHFETNKDLAALYTDIDIALGKTTTRLLLSASLNSTQKELTLKVDEWHQLRRLVHYARDSLSIKLLAQSESSIEKRLKASCRHYAQWKAVQTSRLSSISQLRTQVQELDRNVTQIVEKVRQVRTDAAAIGKARNYLKKLMAQIGALQEKLHRLAAQSKEHQQCSNRLYSLDKERLKESKRLSKLADEPVRDLVELQTILNGCRTEGRQRKIKGPKLAKARSGQIWRGRLRDFLLDRNAVLETAEREIQLPHGHIRGLIDSYVDRLDALDKTEAKSASVPDQLPEPHVTVKLSGSELSKYLLQKRGWIRQALERLNSAVPLPAELRAFFEHCQQIFDSTDMLLGNPFVAQTMGIAEMRYRSLEESPYRLKVPITTLFDTGLSFSVLGEAGAGKTTSFQMYARRRLEARIERELPLYVPLGRVVNAWAAHRSDSSVSAGTPQLEDGLTTYLMSLDGRVTPHGFQDILRTWRCVLLLDGVDEAIRKAPWILDSVRGFAERFPKAQVLTSSRMSGEYLDRMPFCAITLLPFTDDQREKFIQLWFGQEPTEHYAAIADHLRHHRRLADVTRTPLLATVLCVLEEHGVPLPNSEVHLYNERLSLLLGYYDAKKQINRLASLKDDLETVARRLAYTLHTLGKREDDLHSLYEIAITTLAGRCDADRARLVVNELVDPCNVLVPMTVDGKYGFGHLRFQEHLAAIEIVRNRGIDPLAYLDQPWWMGVFVLVAKMNEPIDWLVESYKAKEGGNFSEKTLRAMIAARPRQERERLKQILDKYSGERFAAGITTELKIEQDFEYELADWELDEGAEWPEESLEIVDKSALAPGRDNLPRSQNHLDPHQLE